MPKYKFTITRVFSGQVTALNEVQAERFASDRWIKEVEENTGDYDNIHIEEVPDDITLIAEMYADTVSCVMCPFREECNSREGKSIQSCTDFIKSKMK